MEYDLKKEKELSKLGFKKCWFSDKSGYWFEKKVKYKDFKLQFICETDRNLFLMYNRNPRPHRVRFLIELLKMFKKKNKLQ